MTVSKVSQPYLAITVSLMAILPVVSILAQVLILRHLGNVWVLIGTWFLFWAIGVRMFTAGLNQVGRPGFTAESIFHIKNSESHVIVRELGIANICTGLLAIISLFTPSWRLPAAFVGGLFLGLAGIQHAIKGPISANEKLAMVTDLLVFLIMVAYLLSAVF